jgi:hypothetical protein
MLCGIFLELLDLALQVVHVDLHFVLQPDVAPHIALQLLDQLLVHHRGPDLFAANILPRFIVLDHVGESILHALLDQVF